METLGVNYVVTEMGNLSAKEVVKLHMEKLRSADFVYYSTSGGLSEKRLQNQEMLLISSQKEGITFLCEIANYLHFPNGGVPEDSYAYSPEVYADIPEKNWFKISNIRAVLLDEISSFIPVNKDTCRKYADIANYIEHTGRLQPFYFMA